MTWIKSVVIYINAGLIMIALFYTKYIHGVDNLTYNYRCILFDKIKIALTILLYIHSMDTHLIAFHKVL